MPNSKSHRRGYEEKNRKGRLSEKASSFHGRGFDSTGDILPRPRTVPDLITGRSSSAGTQLSAEFPAKLTKLLLNVTVQRSIGPVQVVISPEATVGDLISAVLRQYSKEGRRPILASTEPSEFDLHYSQFSLESLNRDDKLMALGSRNLYMCPKTTTGVSGGADGSLSTPSTSCSKEADGRTKVTLPWLKFMDFSL